MSRSHTSIATLSTCANAQGSDQVTGLSPASTYPLVAPDTLTATAVSASQINLTWLDRSDNESRFCIEQLNGSWTQLASVAANSVSYSVSGLSPGTLYSFRVRAHTDASSVHNGDSAYSNSDSAITFPAAPTGLSATARSSTRIDLTWSDGEGIESGFYLQRSDAQNPWTTVATLGRTARSYSDKQDLKPATTYTYRIKAYNSGGESDYSSPADATTSGPMTVAIVWSADGGESATNSRPVRFLIYRLGLYEQEGALEVRYTISGTGSDPASPGEDYPASSSITIEAGKSSAELRIVPVDDQEVEAQWESLQVTLQPHIGYYNLGQSPATGRIEDNDVGFMAAGIWFDSQGVRRDDGGYYDTQQWIDHDGIPGTMNQPGSSNPDVAYPLSYQRSTPAVGGTAAQSRFVSATVLFWVRATLPSPNLKIRGVGTGPGGGTFEAQANAVVSDLGGGVSLLRFEGVTSNTPLGQMIDKGALAIDWQVFAADNPANFLHYGQSSNTIYVTGAAATGQFETVLDIGCRNAKGKAPDTDFGHAEVTQAIWSDFANPTPGVLRADTFEMKYWGAVVNGPGYSDADNTYGGLVRYADGKCEAWAELLVAVWAAQGVVGEVWGVVPDTQALNLPAGATLDGFAVKYQLPAQGNAAPQWAFTDHAVVRLRSPVGVYETVFDPSYGLLFDNEQAWIDGAVDKFFYSTSDGAQHMVYHEAGDDDFVFSPR